jgi:hypothetical protein
MAHIQKTITYSLPDEMFGITSNENKTSTAEFNGPSTMVVWIDKETGSIDQTFDKDDYTDAPVPLNCRVLEINAEDSDEDTIKIALLLGGLEKPKMYEIQVGPSVDRNVVVKDPSDVRMVFDEMALVADVESDIKIKTMPKTRDDAFIRDVRDGILTGTDGTVSEDMPESLKAEWIAYRQKLRDIPSDWSAVPNHLIRFPEAPDDKGDIEFDDDENDIIMVTDRTSADNDAIGQFYNISGVDENS